MVGADLPTLPLNDRAGRRLVNSRFPPIALFDDVASAEEFDALYRLQVLTNPRIKTEVGNLGLLPHDEIPFGIRGCSYATGPFTHVNPDGSRFSDGSYGMLYIADTTETAIREVAYHQDQYWSGVPDLHYERFVFRELKVSFQEGGLQDATALASDDPIYDADSYHASRALGVLLKTSSSKGLKYWSVRNPGAHCWGLFTPSVVSDIIQASHYDMVWADGRISSMSRLESVL